MNNINSYFISYLLFFQFISYFLYLKFENYIFLLCYFFIGFASFFTIRKVSKSILLISIFVVSIFLIFSMSSRENSFILNAYNVLLGVFAFLSAYVLYLSDRFYNYIKVMFWAYSLMILYYFYMFGLSDPDLYNNIFVKGSRNYVSAIYIFLFCLLILSYDKDNIKVPIIYPMVTFLGCIILYGRSGIIISFVIMMYLYFFNKRYLLFKLALIIAVIFMVVFNLEQIMSFFIEKTSFSYGVESERTVMIQEYKNGILYSLDNFILGFKLDECCATIKLFDSNPHNSFIAGHIRYGIFHLIFVLSLLTYILFSRNSLYIFISLAYFFRLFLDQLGLFSPLDVILFYIIFLINGNKCDKRIA